VNRIPTPDTDALARGNHMVPTEFSRDLERDLNEMTLRWELTNDALFSERAIADRLADALLDTLSAWITAPDAEQAAKALAAWKEARSE